MGTIDLSELRNKKSSDTPAIESLSDEERERLEKLAEENEPEADRVLTAFLVLMDSDGSVIVSPDLSTKVVRDEIPTTNLIHQAVTTIAKDIQVQETAQYTTMAMQQMAMAAQKMMADQQIASQLHL